MSHDDRLLLTIAPGGHANETGFALKIHAQLWVDECIPSPYFLRSLSTSAIFNM